MANIKSEKKRIEVRERNRQANASFKSKMRTVVKKVKAAVENGEKENAEKLLPEAISLIDKSVKLGIQHENTAARQKSQLCKLVNSLSVEAAA